MENEILTTVNKYYTERIKKFGATPSGVDWNSLETQYLRFDKLSNVIEKDKYFSVLDFGCGYGALYDYLSKTENNFSYMGFDISDEMINEAKKNNAKPTKAIFTNNLAEKDTFDYTIASGIFNVKPGITDEEWIKYIEDILAKINSHSKKGFSFNMLTSYSDKELMKDYLFYAHPAYFFDYCKSHFSKFVSLLHDYPIYEFTIIIKK